MLNAIGFGLNQGWYNTSKPHKSAGFDLTFTVSAVYVPDADLFYDTKSLGLKEVELVTPTDGKAPTFYGPAITPVYRYKSAPSVTFNGPPGVDPPKLGSKHVFPVPIANLGIGIIKGTEIKLRFLPKFDLGDNNYIRLFGIGVLHDVKQYIPGVKELPFDLSLFAAYTKFNAQANLEGTFPDNGTEQLGKYDIKAWTVQALISKKIGVITIYGGLGYSNFSSNLKFSGSYELYNTSFGSTTLIDPVNVNLSSGGARATGGFRLKFAVFTLHTDYTIQKQNILSAGIGISIR